MVDRALNKIDCLELADGMVRGCEGGWRRCADRVGEGGGGVMDGGQE